MRLLTAPGYISVNLSHQYLMNSRNQLSRRYFAYPQTPSTLWYIIFISKGVHFGDL